MSLRTWAAVGSILIVLLLATLGWQVKQGTKGSRQSPTPVAAAQPLEITLLPDFKMSALYERRETVERPLFVPTRRPAPPPEVVLAVEEEPSNKVERGLFVLSGTALQGQTRIAFLRNAKDNKPKTVRVGDEVEGMSVAVITADKVVLTAGGQEEELPLKVVMGAKGAVTPATPPQQQQTQQQQQQLQQAQQQLQQAQQRTGQAPQAVEQQAAAGEASGGGRAARRARAARNNAPNTP